MSTRHFLKNPTYEKTMSLIQKCCELNGVDQSHGLPHAIDIACHVNKAVESMPIEQKVSDKEKENIILSALLHDVDDRKYFKSMDFSNAKEILGHVLEGEEGRIKEVITMIDMVAFSKNGNKIHSEHPTYYYFTRYADRIDAVGEIGLWRCYQYSKIVQNPFSTPETAKPQSKEELYQIMEGRDTGYIQRGGTSVSVIDHMFDKLLHIKLPQEIKNPYMEQLYQQGHDQIVTFILKHSSNGYKDAQKDLLQRMEQRKLVKSKVSKQV